MSEITRSVIFLRHRAPHPIIPTSLGTNWPFFVRRIRENLAWLGGSFHHHQHKQSRFIISVCWFPVRMAIMMRGWLGSRATTTTCMNATQWMDFISQSVVGRYLIHLRAGQTSERTIGGGADGASQTNKGHLYCAVAVRCCDIESSRVQDVPYVRTAAKLLLGLSLSSSLDWAV